MKKSELLDLIGQVIKEDYLDEPTKNIRPADIPKNKKYEFEYLTGDVAFFTDKNSNIYSFHWEGIDKSEFSTFVDREIIHTGKSEDEEEYKDADIEVTPEVLEAYVNTMLNSNMIGKGIDDYTSGIEFVKIDKELANYLLDDEFKNEKGKLYKVLQPLLKEGNNKMKKSELTHLIKECYSELIKEGVDDYGIRWKEFDRNGRQITKEKYFSNDAALKKFTAKLMEKDNFCCIDAWLSPYN